MDILSLITIVILSTSVLNSCFPTPSKTLGISIYEAMNNWSSNTSVTVKGVVIGYPARTINSAKGPIHLGGFSGVLFIEDKKSGIAVNNIGLNETISLTPNSYNFNIGDVVSVTGTLVKIKYNYYKITIKSISDISKSGTFDVEADDLTTASTFAGENLRLIKISGMATDISDVSNILHINKTNEAFELVTTNLGTVTVIDNTYGKILDFNKHISNGDNVDVTGIVYTYYGNYVVYPRIQADIAKK